MFRGFFAFAGVGVGVAQFSGQLPGACQDCAFDLTALEEFSIDFQTTSFTTEGGDEMNFGTITTVPFSDTMPIPSDHGSIAVHARNLQLKVDSHLEFPDLVPGQEPRFWLLDVAGHRGIPLDGMHIHEELHVNGLAGQASFHLNSPIVQLCFQLDNLPPVASIQHDQIEAQLQQAEQMAPAIIQQSGVGATVDGQVVMGMSDRYKDHFIFFDDSSHPVILGARGPAPQGGLMNAAVKFDNYANTVGDQFTVRACEIERQSATQSFLATNPDARIFVARRIAAQQERLQALLEPQLLNTRFNFIPLEMANLMVPAEPHCATELAQIPPRASGTLQIAAFGVCSFVLGITITFGVLRKKSVISADQSFSVLSDGH